MRYRRSLNEKTDRCEDSCIDNISLGIDEEMSTHSRSKSSDVSTNENILSTMEDPILNFAKSMAPPRSCSYSKWEKFAFYDPNEYAYRKGTQIEPDMESYLNGFRTPSLGILGTNEQFDKVTALSWMWEMCEDFVQSAPIEYFGEVFHKIEELKSLQTIKEDREEYEHWSYALSKCSIFANIHKQFRRYKSKYRGCVFSAETMISMAETEFERFESWCKRSASLKEFSRIADDDRQRALVRKDRLRKRLQKSNAEKSSIRTESGNGIDYGDNSLFLGSLGEYTLDELLRYLERDGQENKCQKKRNRRTRGKRKGSSKNEDIVGVKEERSRENVDDTSITHQHKELSSKNDEEHSLDSITDSCKIDDDGLLTEGASTDCMAKDERTQQEMSTSDSGNFNSDIVLSPRRLFSVGSEYTTTTVSTNKAEENDCCDRLIVTHDKTSAQETGGTSRRSEDADDAHDKCAYNSAQICTMLPSVSITVDYDEVFRPLPENAIRKLHGWDRQFEEFKVIMWELGKKSAQQRVKVNCSVEAFRMRCSKVGINLPSNE